MNQTNFSDDENRGERPENPLKLDGEETLHERANKAPSPPLDDDVETENATAASNRGSAAAPTPVVAELATESLDKPANDANATDPTEFDGESNSSDRHQHEFHNMAAIGGAVGSLVLGIWSIICSFITFYSFINACIAIALGLYGMTSGRRKMAIVGIVLGVIGLALALAEVSESLNYIFTEEEV